MALSIVSGPPDKQPAGWGCVVTVRMNRLMTGTRRCRLCLCLLAGSIHCSSV
jgi:hypothetical protein